MTSAKKTKVNQLIFAITGDLKNGTNSSRACTSSSGLVRKTAVTTPAKPTWQRSFTRPGMPSVFFFVTLR